MRRAFIGFSTPVGYDYKNQAERARSDLSSSPNPILYGAMGLMTLYDELWFATPSLCPQNMRGLDYVQFLDGDGPDLSLKDTNFEEAVKGIYDSLKWESDPESDDPSEKSMWDIISEYLRFDAGVDNHTHGINFFDRGLGGNADDYNLIVDTWIISRFKELDFSLVLNPMTAKIARGRAIDAGDPQRLAQPDQLDLTERVLKMRELRDISTPAGPYHPCLEELRSDHLIEAFREWMDDKRTAFDNKDARMIEAEVNAKVREFTRSTLRDAVRPDTLSAVGVDLVKDSLLELLPASSVLLRIAEAVGHNKKVADLRWQAFIALAHYTVADATD